jgi:amino acid permease
MLPLAFGFAKSGPSGIIPTLALFVLFGSMSAYTMTSYADLAEKTNSKTIGDLWTKVVGKYKEIANYTILLLCFSSCIFYSAFIGDILYAVVSAAGLNGFFAKRSIILSVITAFVLIPLCLVDDMSSLQFSSNLGVAGVLFTLFAHIKRYLDGSYAPGGKFYALLPKNRIPHFPTTKFSLWTVKPGVVTLVNMLCLAFLAHYNAINYYKELDQETPKRYQTTIALGYGISTVVFMAMLYFGYNLFGTTSLPLLLNNFHKTDDIYATLARIGTGIAMTFAYPLMFAGFKSVAKTTASRDKPFEFKYRMAACVVAINAIAMQFSEEDVSIILGIVGSILGCGAAYVIPSFMRLQYLRKSKSGGTLELIINHIIMALGVIFGGLGVWDTITSPVGHH